MIKWLLLGLAIGDLIIYFVTGEDLHFLLFHIEFIGALIIASLEDRHD